MPFSDNNANADELLSAYLDGELTAEQRAEVEQRLEHDPAARETLAGLRAVSSELKQLPAMAAQAGLRDEVLRRVQDELAPATVALHSQNVREQDDRENVNAEASGVRLPFGRSPRGWGWAGLAVAAALVMMIWLPDEEAGGPREIAKLPAAASEPRQPAEMSARPEVESAPSEIAASSAAVDLAAPASETLMPSAPGAPASMAAARSRLADESRFSGLSDPLDDAAADSVADLSAESPLLVVRVNLRREAFQRGLVDQVFTTQGIAVESDGNEVQATRSRRSAAVSNARNALPIKPTAASNTIVAAAARNADSQVLVVDAPATQFAAALDDLRNDFLNCNSLEVASAEGESLAALESKTEASINSFGFAAEAPAKASSAKSSPKSRPQEIDAELAPFSQQWFSYNRVGGGGFGGGGDGQSPEKPKSMRKQQVARQQAAQQQAAYGNAYRLKLGEVQQLADQSPPRGVMRSAAANRQAIPAPTDPSARVQALVIIEAEAAPAMPAGSPAAADAPAR